MLSYVNGTDVGSTQVLDVVDCVGQKEIQRSIPGIDPTNRSTDTRVKSIRHMTHATISPLKASVFSQLLGTISSISSSRQKAQPQSLARLADTTTTRSSTSSKAYTILIGGKTVLEAVTQCRALVSASYIQFHQRKGACYLSYELGSLDIRVQVRCRR